MTAGHGGDNVSTAELALDKEGKFLALRVAITLNIGAYLTPRSAGPGTNNVGGVAGVYTTPAIHVQTTGVFTNMTPTGPYRGAGREGFVPAEHARDNVSTAELALDKDGKFLALRVAITLNIGAYLTPRSAGPGTNNVGGVAGVYTTPAIHVQTTGVFTNMTPTGPYRGAGRPEATYAIERVIDLAARELEIDPIELRRRNLIPSSAMPFKTGLVFTYDCGDFGRILDMALAKADYKGVAQRRAAARSRGKLLGIGIAIPIEVAGGPFTSVNPDTAEVRVNPDGSVLVFSGSTSMGQGNETAFAQIVSGRLGVEPARVQVLWGDSDSLDAGRGAGGGGGGVMLVKTPVVCTGIAGVVYTPATPPTLLVPGPALRGVR